MTDVKANRRMCWSSQPVMSVTFLKYSVVHSSVFKTSYDVDNVTPNKKLTGCL